MSFELRGPGQGDGRCKDLLGQGKKNREVLVRDPARRWEGQEEGCTAAGQEEGVAGVEPGGAWATWASGHGGGVIGGGRLMGKTHLF